MFKYEPKKVPDIKLERSWKLEDGSLNEVYRAQDWSFETAEEADLEYIEGAIYAWIAWYDFVSKTQEVLDVKNTIG